VAEVFAHKSAAGITRFDDARTKRIIARLLQLNAGPLTEVQVARVFSFLLHFFAFEYDPAMQSTATTGGTVETVVDAAVAISVVEDPPPAPSLKEH